MNKKINAIIQDLKILLPCYSEKDYYKVLMAYCKINKINSNSLIGYLIYNFIGVK
jgi:hypothetical protein